MASAPAVTPADVAPAQPGGPAGPGYDPVPAQLPPAIRQVFLPVRLGKGEALAQLVAQQSWAEAVASVLHSQLVYRPELIGLATVRYVHSKTRQTEDRSYTYLLPVSDAGHFVDWSMGEAQLDAESLENVPAAPALFGRLPAGLATPARFRALEKELSDHLYYHTTATVLYNPHLKLYSAPDETQKSFQRRCREAARAARDAEADRIHERYQAQFAQLGIKLRREERELDEDKTEYGARKREEFFSGAETVLDMFTGRRMRRGISTASRKRRLTKQAESEVEESEEAIADLQRQVQELQDALRGELDDLTNRWVALIDDVREEQVHPRRTDVRINLFGLAWVPAWEIAVPGQAVRYRVPGF
jgi:hypothetical protein